MRVTGGGSWADLLGFAALLAAWQLGALASHPLALPAPGAVLAALGRLWATGAVASAVAHTTAHALGGFAIALLIGIAIGLFAGLQPFVHGMVRPLIGLLQGVPPIAWIVLALLWFGTGGATAAFTVMAATLPLIVVTTIAGAQTVDSTMIQMARSFRASTRVLLSDIYFPHLIAVLFPAVLTGMGLSWKVALMAELLAGAHGIGEHLGVARVNLDTPAVFAWIVIAVGLMFLIEYLVLLPLQRRLEPWRDQMRSHPVSRGQPDVRVGCAR
jgi:NitT/TauT family transport system permease protein